MQFTLLLQSLQHQSLQHQSLQHQSLQHQSLLQHNEIQVSIYGTIVILLVIIRSQLYSLCCVDFINLNG